MVHRILSQFRGLHRLKDSLIVYNPVEFNDN